MEAGLDSTENSFRAREAAPRHRDRLAGGQGHGEEQLTHQGTLPGTGGAGALSQALLTCPEIYT